LVEAGLSREAAYAIVQRNALRAFEEELPLRQLLEADPEAAALLDAATLDRARPSRLRQGPGALRRGRGTAPARRLGSHLRVRRGPADADSRQGPGAD